MKQMNCVKISSIFCRIVGPLVLGWAPIHFILGTQLAPGEKKMLVCIPAVLIRNHVSTSNSCLPVLVTETELYFIKVNSKYVH